VTVAATLVTAPLIAIHFGNTSLVGLPANVLAAQAVASDHVARDDGRGCRGRLAPGPAVPLVALTGPLLGYLAGLARLAAGVPGAQVALPLTGLVILCALGAVLLATPRRAPGRSRTRRRRGGSRGRRASVGWCWRRTPAPPARRWRAGSRRRSALLAACRRRRACSRRRAGADPASALAPPPAGDLRVTALDIGQGDANVAPGRRPPPCSSTPGRRGRASSASCDARAFGLDALVVTHPQADTDGGAPAVLSALPVGTLVDGRAGDRSPTSTAIERAGEATGDHVVAHRPVQVLQAERAAAADPVAARGSRGAGHRPNDRAIVALADAYGATALLTADAESNVLAPLDLPPVDVLKVSHHGKRRHRPARPARTAATADRAHRGRVPQHLRTSDAGHAPGAARRGPDRPPHRPGRHAARGSPARRGDRRAGGLTPPPTP